MEPYISNPIIVYVSEHLYPVNNFLETIRTIHSMCLQEWQLSNPIFEFTPLDFVGS